MNSEVDVPQQADSYGSTQRSISALLERSENLFLLPLSEKFCDRHLLQCQAQINGLRYDVGSSAVVGVKFPQVTAKNSEDLVNVFYLRQQRATLDN